MAELEYPSIEECHSVLRAGRIQTGRQSYTVFRNLFFNIFQEYRWRVALRGQSHLAKSLKRIDRASSQLMQELQTFSLAGETIGMSASIIPQLTIQDTMDALSYNLKNCSQLIQMTDRDLENWLFGELYDLYEILKGKRPGNSIAGPLYRFTIKAAGLAGIRVTVTSEAFRMRIKRLRDRRRDEPEIPIGVARLLHNVPPPPDPVLLCSIADNVVLAWKPSFCARSKFRPYSRGS